MLDNELIDSSRDSRKVAGGVIVDDDDTAPAHPRGKETQRFQGWGIQVQIDMHEGEAPRFEPLYLGENLGNPALVQLDEVEGTKDCSYRLRVGSRDSW